MLVRNEEHFVAWSLMNALEFCDHVLVMDNCSTDRTRRIVENIADRHENVELTVVPDVNDTQKFLKGWFGTKTWVLGLDGDEIHDPVGLSRLRSRLQSGAFDEYWAISGIYCHVTELDFHQSRAFGYSSPPAKAGTKLFNFNAIENWMSRWRRHERLHGPKVFRPGYSRDSVYRFSASENDERWDTADLRCLHLCFMPRTPAETGSAMAHQTRKNPVETRLLRRMARKIESIKPDRKDYRQKRYARGSIVPHDIHGFGKPDDFQEFDDRCDHVMRILSGIQTNAHVPWNRPHGVGEVQ